MIINLENYNRRIYGDRNKNTLTKYILSLHVVCMFVQWFCTRLGKNENQRNSTKGQRLLKKQIFPLVVKELDGIMLEIYQWFGLYY